MGSLVSKQSSGNTVTTRNHTSEENSFQNFTNSLRRSLRIKRSSTNASDGPRPQSQLPPSDLSKTPALGRSKLPESFNQPPESTTPTSLIADPGKVIASYTSTVASAPAPESPKVKIPPEEVGKAMSILKGAIEAKGKEAEGVGNRKAGEISENIKETVNSGLQQVSTFKDDVITNGKKFGGAVDKKLDKAGENVQTKVNEGRVEVESILSRLSPADNSEEQSPEVEISPKPVTASLLAALEKRKMRKDEVEKRDSSPPPGVANVLESIAVGTAAVRSHEAANLVAAFTSPLEKTEAPSKVVEVGPKVDIPPEEVGKAMSILKGAIEAKGKGAEEVANEKLYEVDEKVQRKSEN